MAISVLPLLTFASSTTVLNALRTRLRLTLHGDVVQQERESDSDDNRVLQSLHDTSLVELFDDDCGSDLFPLDPVVGQYYSNWRGNGWGQSRCVNDFKVKGGDDLPFSSALSHRAVCGSAVMKNHLRIKVAVEVSTHCNGMCHRY